jgi:hypothetical protein
MSAPAAVPCSSCGKAAAPSKCACHAVSYCDRVCQQAHWKAAHKKECATRLLPKQYPREETLAKLREALPEYTVEDHSALKFEDARALEARLTQHGNEKVVAIVIRERKLHTTTASEALFQEFGRATSSEPLSVSAAILVFHRDNFYYTRVLDQFAELVQWLRRSLRGEMQEICMVCQCDIALWHRVVCMQCGTGGVCDKCVGKITATSPDKKYKCPNCRFVPPKETFIKIKMPQQQPQQQQQTYKSIEIRVDLIPPEMYKKANQEQHFFAVIESLATLHHCMDGLFAVARDVREQRVRMVALNREDLSQGEFSRLDESEFTEEVKAAMVAARQVTVPVVLHYEPSTIRLTAVGEKADGVKQTLWQQSIPIHVESKLCVPRPSVASTWKRMEENPDLLVPKDDLYASLWDEPFEYEGPEFRLVEGEGEPVFVQLKVQCVVNKATREPMSFYVDRVWAVRQIVIFGKKDLFPLAQ